MTADSLGPTLERPRPDALADTVAGDVAGGVAGGATSDVAGDATLADPRAAGAPTTRAAPPSIATRTTTILPRVDTSAGEVRLVTESRARYETERVLGEGGMGIVALAHDHDIDRKVALKRVRREVGSHGLARFAEEVRTIGHLEHPNIIPIHDVGVDEQGDYFFVMKYVEGQTLEQIIEKLQAGDPQTHARFTWEARVQVFIGLLRALAYAHDRGVIHRDIKPANIMVGPYGEVVLMDWGIARPIHGADLPAQSPTAQETAEAETSTRKRIIQTQSSALVGTPMYMSPEQARGEPDLDARSDLYSACVVFHELMTLRHYLEDKETMPAILVGVMGQELPAASKISTHAHPAQGSIPAEHAHFIVRGMKKAREARWQSAQQMIA
ncbi:MAG: serine/threonine protein kinase [Sandaracinaceae bacterium]|nr:serine/threonine protein kinase [Sandaracinaceae bacterium]